MNECLTIIRGASGVGKTTLIRDLLRDSRQIVCIDVDTIRCMFSTMDWEKGYKEYVNALKIAISMINKLFSLGYSSIIVSDTFRPEQLNDFISELTIQYRIHSLYCDNDILIKRLKKRNLPYKSFDEIVEFNDKIKNHDLPENMETDGVATYIDVTNGGSGCLVI